MRTQDIEPELEALLLRLVPDLPAQWQGASEEEIARLEQIAGRPLPRCYRWFLVRMGRSMGSIAYPTVDFSAQRILSAYATGGVASDPRFLMIGHESRADMPMHVFYDLDRCERDDALVLRASDPHEDSYEQFETLREMVAWGELWLRGVEGQPFRCSGTVEDQDGDVLARLVPLLHGLGFTIPIPTGPYCGLFERADACMITKSIPGREPRTHSFSLGARDVGRLRRLLGEIASAHAFDLEIMEWEPPLP